MEREVDEPDEKVRVEVDEQDETKKDMEVDYMSVEKMHTNGKKSKKSDESESDMNVGEIGNYDVDIEIKVNSQQLMKQNKKMAKLLKGNVNTLGLHQTDAKEVSNELNLTENDGEKKPLIRSSLTPKMEDVHIEHLDNKQRTNFLKRKI